MSNLGINGWITENGKKRRVTIADQLTQYVIDIATGCHNWIGHKDRYGYGQTSIKHKTVTAHRMSYEYHVSPIPKDLVTRHTCHNRACINPEHLILGTPQDNSKDMIAASRQAFGEKNGYAILTEAKVRQIKDLLAKGHTVKTIARMLNLGISGIVHVKHKRTWRHVV